MVVQAPC